jgi:hypothetical protein
MDIFKELACYFVKKQVVNILNGQETNYILDLSSFCFEYREQIIYAAEEWNRIIRRKQIMLVLCVFYRNPESVFSRLPLDVIKIIIQYI